MQKKLYKSRSTQFNSHEHIMYKMFYGQNGTERNIGLYGRVWGYFIYFSEMSIFMNKSITDMSTIKNFKLRYLILKQEWEAERIPIRKR